MKRISACCLVALASCLLVLGVCEKEQKGTAVQVEKVEMYKASLPPVPKIPVPNVPLTYPDSSYSVFGVRKAMEKTMDSVVTVTAHIVKIYEKPVCAEGMPCRVEMPHLYLADDPKEALEKRWLRLVGYAQSFQELEDARLIAMDPSKVTELGEFLVPIVWDWKAGHKYKITGRFSRQSMVGFMDPDGLIDYQAHECLDCPPPLTPEELKAQYEAEQKAKEEAGKAAGKKQP